tara:strand:- start:827 stop:1879 length:1053 start_codon:yes stop_codon:yes gene_type:complete
LKKLPKFSKSAILVEQQQPLVVDYIELPSELSYGQVLVEIIVSGICGSQIGEIKGVKGPDKFLPHLLGHEGFGKVLSIGPGVKHVSNNDSVILHWRAGAGIQSDPPVYKWNGKNLNAGWVTTFNKYAVISENRCTRVKNDLNPDIGALFGCAITTGFGVVENNAQLKIGESVVIFGAGGIGLNIVQAAKLKTAYPIIAIDIFKSRLDLAEKLGATHCINSKEESPEQEINKILGDNSLDVFIDNTGISNVIETGYRLVKKDGRVILVGVPHYKSMVSLNTLPLHFGKSLIGSHGGDTVPNLDIPRYINLYRNKKISFEDIISSHFPLESINKAIEAMQDGKTAGRVLINF